MENNLFKNIQKRETKSSMCSDSIVLIDSNGNELELYWFSHEVILRAKNKEYVYLKKDNCSLYNLFSNIAKRIKSANELVGGDFVQGNKFNWHHMARSWDRSFEDEAGMIASIDDKEVNIKFSPSKLEQRHKKSEKYETILISMGGPDGYVEPYQSISNIFALLLNEMLQKVPYAEKDNEM